MPASAEEVARLDGLLPGSTLWGAELDVRYRVLAVTLELTPDRHPAGGVADRRVQLLLSPVSRIQAVLQRRLPDGRGAIEQFDVDQLPAVLGAAFAGTAPEISLAGDVEPLDARFPELSLQGESQALDGRAHLLTLSVAGENERHLDLQATFDEVELRDPAGTELTV